MKTLVAKKVFVLFVLVWLVLLVSSCIKNQSDEKLSDGNINNNQIEGIKVEELEQKYEQSLVEILRPYWQDDEIVGLKDKILDLRAPAKYLDLHFNLVVAFELIEQGRETFDSVKIESGLARIKKLESQYSWLKLN